MENKTFYNEIKTIIFEVIDELNYKLKNDVEIDDSGLDSLDFVTFVMNVEEKIYKNFDKKKISLTFNKDFLNVNKFVDHISNLM